MICPGCHKNITITDEDKGKVLKYGSLIKVCPLCGSDYTIERKNVYDVMHREKRKEAGMCTSCGKYPAMEGRSTCKKCLDYNAASRATMKSLHYNDPAEKKKKPFKLDLDEIAKAARKEGLTYGQYVAKYGL